MRRAAAAAVLAVLLIFPSASAAPQAWSSFRGDDSNTGYRAAWEGPAGGNLTAAWNFTCDGPVAGAPMVCGRGLVCATENGTVHCLDAVNGDSVWSAPGFFGMRSSPTLSDDGNAVYVCDGDGNVTALDISDGSILWTWSDAMQTPIAAPALAAQGRVVVGTNGALVCLDAETGGEMWTFPGCGSIVYAAPVLSGDSVLYASCDGGTLYSVDIETGVEAWNATMGYMPSSPSVSNGRVFFGSYDKRINCLSASDGSMLWNYSTGSTVFSSPAVTPDYVVVGSDNGTLHCVNAADGQFVWSQSIQSGKLDGSPIVIGEYIAMCTRDGLLIADIVDGAVLVRFETGDCSGLSPAYYDGRLYYGGLDGVVRCIEAEPGPAPEGESEGGDGNGTADGGLLTERNIQMGICGLVIVVFAIIAVFVIHERLAGKDDEPLPPPARKYGRAAPPRQRGPGARR